MMFLGDGEMAIRLHLGLKMLPLGYHLYLAGSNMIDCTELWLNYPLICSMAEPEGETSGLSVDFEMLFVKLLLAMLLGKIISLCISMRVRVCD